jgi:hypothetical protein
VGTCYGQAEENQMLLFVMIFEIVSKKLAGVSVLRDFHVAHFCYPQCMFVYCAMISLFECRIHRPLSSNQRMQFAIDLWGNTIATGTEDGRLLTFDTRSFEKIYDDKVSNNCLNCVSFHPYSALLIATSGERNFDLPGDDESDGNPVWTSNERSSAHNMSSKLPFVCGLEKWSELQVYGLHANDIILKQLVAAYTTNESTTEC